MAETREASPVSADRKRRDLLDAAATMFSERGYVGTSIDDIADALGSTKGRIYHHYRSKADLYLDVHIACLTHMIGMIAPISARTDLAPAEAMSAMAYQHLRALMTAGPIHKAGLQGIQRRAMKLSTGRQRAAMARVLAMRDEYEECFANVIRRGIASGEFTDRPARLLCKPIQGALNWALVWFEPGRGTSSSEVDAMARTIVAFLVDGLLIRPPQAVVALSDKDTTPSAPSTTVRDTRQAPSCATERSGAGDPRKPRSVRVTRILRP